jgi:hypothetical protein
MRAAFLLVVLVAIPVVADAQLAAPAVCRAPAASDSARVPSALLPRVRSACARLTSDPERYQSPRVRSRSGMEMLAHGVAQLIRGRVDMEPLLKALQPRLYRMRFQPIGAPHAAPSPPFDVVVDGNANNWLTTEWPASTGLFRVSLYPALPMGSPRIGEEAWVLVDEGRFAETSARFDEIAMMVDGWGDSVPEADAFLFLRASLDDMAAPR